MKFTYVGGGADSPSVINFMGRQEFVRGEATEVTDKIVLNKIKNCPTFVEGEVSQKDLSENDKAAAKKEAKQKEEDKKTNAKAKKANG